MVSRNEETEALWEHDNEMWMYFPVDIITVVLRVEKVDDGVPEARVRLCWCMDDG